MSIHLHIPEVEYPDEPVIDEELEKVLSGFYLKFNMAELAFAVFIRAGKMGRNEKCPCESGKKVKQCHGGVHGTSIESTYLKMRYAISKSPKEWIDQGRTAYPVGPSASKNLMMLGMLGAASLLNSPNRRG